LHLLVPLFGAALDFPWSHEAPSENPGLMETTNKKGGHGEGSKSYGVATLLLRILVTAEMDL
jgi:hypothetical protein